MYYNTLKKIITLLPLLLPIASVAEECQMGAINIVKAESATNQVINITTVGELNKHKNAGKATVVEIGATWCKPCQELAEPYKNLAKEYSNITFLAADGDIASDITKEFAVEGYPTLIFFDTSGDKLFQRIGGITKGGLSDLVEKLNKGTLQKQDIKTKKVNPNADKATQKATPQPARNTKQPQKKAAPIKKAAPAKKDAMPADIVRKGPGGKRIRYVAVED